MRELNLVEAQQVSGGICVPCAFIVASLARQAAIRGMQWAARNTGMRFAAGSVGAGAGAAAGADLYEAVKEELQNP